MFFAVKWHYDKEKNNHNSQVISTVGKIIAVFAVAIPGLLLATFTFARMIGLDLTFPQ